MKKLLLVTTLALILAFAVVGLASANNGPHGGYTPTTDACAGCHRAHTASGARLLLADDITDFCLVCHGNGGTGADTSVTLGRYMSRDLDQVNEDPGEDALNFSDPIVGPGLLGGGFEFALDPSDQSGYDAVTGKHNVGESVVAVWGGQASGIGVTETLAASVGTFDCADCHDPHGNSNYRILRTATNGASGISVPQVDEGAGKSYVTETWRYSSTGGMSSFCAACHSDYHQTTTGVGQNLGAFSGNVATYTHRIDMPWDNNGAVLTRTVGYGAVNPETIGVASGSVTYRLRLADDFGATADDIVVCTTCHYAHGSSSSMATYSQGATLDGDQVTAGVQDSAALLALDNRGVCQVCHQK